MMVGCSDDLETVRKIQAARQAKRQTDTKVDHIGEAMNLVSNLIELDPTVAGRQIVYHLNAWHDARPRKPVNEKSAGSSAGDGQFRPTELMRTVSHVLSQEAALETLNSEVFVTADVQYLRSCYLLREVSNWVLERAPKDPLWHDWLAEKGKTISESDAEALSNAVRLFDWVTRNIALEPFVLSDPTPPPPSLPLGMTFRGAGYRQTLYETLFRGTGDRLQRNIAFISLCRQASIPACMLATVDGAGNLQPWLSGVLIGGEVYLFDGSLGIPVPGPGQKGIATLSEARTDASVLRRMNVQGWFEYPVQKDDVQQCGALLVVEPEAASIRAKQLQESLTGNLRMVLYEDVDATAAAFEKVTGIASARIWDVPLKARVYDLAMEKVTSEDPMIAFFTLAPWSILEGEFGQAKKLALGRWRHLQGRFEDEEDTATEGAKSLFLAQRQPEFEIADLRIDVELQKQYGIRRELGVSPEVYDRQVQQVQQIMRQGKITATFWLSLIQFDDQRWDLAENWFGTRVLGDDQDSRWEQTARYNLARAYENLSKVDKAVELYKTEGDVQEHGNRIRARLIAKSDDAESSPE